MVTCTGRSAVAKIRETTTFVTSICAFQPFVAILFGAIGPEGFQDKLDNFDNLVSDFAVEVGAEMLEPFMLFLFVSDEVNHDDPVQLHPVTPETHNRRMRRIDNIGGAILDSSKNSMIIVGGDRFTMPLVDINLLVFVISENLDDLSGEFNSIHFATDLVGLV